MSPFPVRIESLESRTLLAAQLLADVNPVSEGTSASESVVLNDTLFFGWGSGLYKTDGTLDGTTRVATVGPGQTTWYAPLAPFPAAGVFLFRGLSAPDTPAVFRSDGTPGGTTPLAPGGQFQQKFHVGDRLAYWFTQDELWVTDGSAAGTARLAAGLTSPISPVVAAVTGNTLFFLTRENNATRLWKSDGTPAGTAAVATLAGATSGPNATPVEMVATGGRVYVKLVTGTTTSTSSYGLFTSDGTAAGTRLVASIGNAAGSLAGLGGKVYFRNASTSFPGYEPWVSDGTTTARLKDLIVGTGGSNPRGFTVVGNTIYFSAAGTVGNPQVFDQVWKSDGTAAGTVLVKTLPAGVSDASGFRAVGGTVHFRAGNGLWKTDGTAAGTTEVALPGISGQGSLGPYHKLADGRLAFFGVDPIHGGEWRFTDGTPAGTNILDLTPETADSGAHGYVELGGKVYFQAHDGNPAVGYGPPSLVATDGTPQGTTVVKRGLSIARPLFRAGNLIYLVIDPRDNTNMQQLWVSDGTTDGTRRIKTLEIPVWNGKGGFLTDVGGTLFFLGRTYYMDPWTLWRSDGTEAGTVQVGTQSIDNLSPTSPLMAVGRTLYFVARTPDAGFAVYKVGADGGAPVLVKDTRPAAKDSNPALLAAMNGRLYFTAKGDDTYRYLWSTDGTPAGTVRVSDVPTGPQYSNETPRPRAAVWDGALYFIGGYGTGDAGLWKTDGTPAGTRPVYRGAIDSVHAGGARLYAVEVLPAPIGSSEVRLLSSDGTAAGTVPLRRTGWVYSTAAHAGRFFFVAGAPGAGIELWSTDGTAAGTRIETDLMPGVDSGIDYNYAGLTVAAGMLVFTGKTPEHGVEPRKWVPGAVTVPGYLVDRHVFYDNSAADGFDPGPGASDDAAVASNKDALLPVPTVAGTLVHRTTFGRGLNGIMVDLANLPAGAALTTDDFVFRTGNTADPAAWPAAPAPATVTVRRGAGALGTDRVTLTWADGDAVRNAWLQVTVKATPNTALAAPDVFYFGNLIGDVSNGWNEPMAVTPSDFAAARRDVGPPPYRYHDDIDINRDGRVNVADLALIRANLGRSLLPVSPAAPAPAAPAPSPQASAAAGPPPTLRSSTRRRTGYAAPATGLLAGE